MPPLKNIKHEMLSRNIIKEKGNLTKAYVETYPDSTEASASSHVGRIWNNGVGVRQRVQEIMVANGLSLPRLTRKLNEHVDSKDERVSLDATKFAVKTHTDQDQSGDTHNHVHLHEAETANLPSPAKLGKLRDLLR